MESREEIRNQIVKRFLLMVSGVAFILLCTAHGKSALLMSAVLILVLCVGIWFIKLRQNAGGGIFNCR